MKLIKTIEDRRFTYLDNLKDIYKHMGYAVKMRDHNHKLDIYEKGTIVPQEVEELVFDQWIT